MFSPSCLCATCATLAGPRSAHQQREMTGMHFVFISPAFPAPRQRLGLGTPIRYCHPEPADSFLSQCYSHSLQLLPDREHDFPTPLEDGRRVSQLEP
jgi:hypothetical protein